MIRRYIYLLVGLVALMSIILPNVGGLEMVAADRVDSGGVQTQSRYGILGRQAPDLTLSNWIDASGKALGTLHLSDYRGKVVYLYFFQHWCPGCHSHGFPTLQSVASAFEGNDEVALLAVQTAFEGMHVNTADKLRRNQVDYDLAIPMAHDSGKDHPRGLPQTMIDYRSGGTPWAVIIDPAGKVVYNHFNIDAGQAIDMIQNMVKMN